MNIVKPDLTGYDAFEVLSNVEMYSGKYSPEVYELLQQIELLVVAGLCQRTMEGKHAYLQDIRKLIDDSLD